MPSVSKEINQLNEAKKAMDIKLAWGFGVARDLAQRSTNAQVKILAKNALEARGARV